MTRVTPYDLVFAELAEARFPAVLDACRRERIDRHDRDRLLLLREMVTLLHDLRPDEGIGDGTDEFVAFVHHAFAFWADGLVVHEVGEAALRTVLTGNATPAPRAPGDADASRTAVRPAAGAPPGPLTRSCYIAVAERQVWGLPVPEAAHEPLDGLFLLPAPGGTLRVLGAFGVHPQRLGLTVAEAAGARADALARADGTPLFAPRLPGGREAGLHEVAGAEELLELGWRLHALTGG
jgi:hypothetical protein